MKKIALMFAVFILCMACGEDQDDNLSVSPQLIIKLNFDPNQERLDNLGQPAMVPVGNAAQSPTIERMSANYIEFAPEATTLLG